MNVEFKTKEQDWENEATIYWFELNGTDYGTGCEFDNEWVGVCESNGESMILDRYGCPATPGDNIEMAATCHCVVTDEMRNS
jgi:hypothetical protein